jgi:hypothetical protein
MLKTILTMVMAGALLVTPVGVWAETIDHAALAAQYEQEAKADREKAQAHREMEKKYGGVQYSKTTNHAGMQNHCKRLIASYEAAAEDAEALAKEHREAAAAH